MLYITELIKPSLTSLLPRRPENVQESRQHLVLVFTNADKIAAAFQDPVGRFLQYIVKFGLVSVLGKLNFC